MYVTPPPTPPPPAGITTGTILAAARITGSCTDLSTQRTAPSDAVLVIEDFSESELSGSTKPRRIGRYTPGFASAPRMKGDHFGHAHARHRDTTVHRLRPFPLGRVGRVPVRRGPPRRRGTSAPPHPRSPPRQPRLRRRPARTPARRAHLHPAVHRMDTRRQRA